MTGNHDMVAAGDRNMAGNQYTATLGDNCYRHTRECGHGDILVGSNTQNSEDTVTYVTD